MVPNPSQGKSVMLVEGPNDEHVIKSICGRLQLGRIDDFRYGKRGSSSDRGKQSLLKALPIHLLESDVAATGIVLDADDDLQACWQAITHALKSVPGKRNRANPMGRPSALVIWTPACRKRRSLPTGCAGPFSTSIQPH